MIKTKIYKHDNSNQLNNYINKKTNDGYELLSCSTKDIFWTFSLYLKESTLIFKIK